ncbi:uncharacterized protein LOC121418055 [Lytechinus variegatus]|uniref:uncharacterized protein LOC121418055 n=1 Tax=Lytechinus variegatus TaxID=7654 RepID=UPI001BB200F5|nr:uncharacterized protein LOC121418055 [Lytechinus variegatus]
MMLVAPKVGYSIFSVNKQPDTLTSPKNSVIDVTDQTQKSDFVNKDQPSGNNGYSFLPQITPSVESTVSSSPKTIKGSGSDTKLTNCPLESPSATGKPYQEPLKTKASWDSVSDGKVHETRVAENLKQIIISPEADSNVDKDADESGCFTSLSQVNGGTSKVKLIHVRPAPDANLPITTTGDSTSDTAVTKIQSQNNSGTPNLRVIQVRPANDPYLKIASTSESRPSDLACRNESSTTACNNTVTSPRLITVKPVHEPLQTKVNDVSATGVQKILDATNEAVPEIKSISTEITVSKPTPPSVATNDVLPIKNLGPLVDPLKWPYPVPPPKIQNWTTEPLEQSKGHLPSSGQGEVSLKNLFDLSHGPPTCPEESDIVSRSQDPDVVPAANGGDFSKPSKKTRKEPSNRRFPKSTNPGMTPDTSSDIQQTVMDLKTKKKKLKRFLKLARRHKNKPAKAE